MLGRLARYLRMMGFDAEYSLEDDEEILRRALEEGRVLVTRDKHLCARAGGSCVFVASQDLEEQLAQLRLELGLPLTMPSEPQRCSVCNARLRYVGAVAGRRMWVCERCGQPYWLGSHVKRVEEVLDKLRRLYSFTPLH